MMASDGTGYRRGRFNVLRRLFQPKRKARDEADQEWRACMREELKDIDRQQRIPEYDAAILSCSVTLQQIVEARYRLRTYGLREKDSLAGYQEKLWRAYQRANGRIEEYYFSMGGNAAVVLTGPNGRGKTKDLDLVYPVDDLRHLTPDFESCLWTVISQFQAIAELDLKFNCQDAVFLELYLIVIYLFVAVEAQQASNQLDAPGVRTPAVSTTSPVTAEAIEDIASGRIEKAMTYANKHLNILADKIEQYSRRAAQIVYTRGMYIGIFSVLALTAVYVYIIFRIGSADHWTSQTQLRWHLIAIAIASGALGAAVSVMLRVSNRPLSIAYSAGSHLIGMAGCFRPIVGAIFGLVFYVLINAGLLQVLAAPHDIGARAFYVAAICFAAGFSERLAQDVIVRALPTAKGTETEADKSPARRPEESRPPESRPGESRAS